MKIVGVVGARPNFMKIAPIVGEFRKREGVRFTLVHTGQHYDDNMSGSFFEELGIPRPDIDLGVGSSSNAAQTAKIMIEFEKALKKERADLVLVVGDVNSTLACALVASKIGIKVAHIEAGLRSFDMNMPEEINRLLTDQISDFLFTTSRNANSNLQAEGIDKSRIFFVGNVMIDTLLKNKERASKSKVMEKLGVQTNNFVLLTLHRPKNVDKKEKLEIALSILEGLASCVKIIFPTHPRTTKMIKSFGLDKRLRSIKGLILTEPLSYLDFLCLMSNASLVLTDSGGIQEETTILGTPCITLRDNTERPITVEQGTNLVLGLDEKRVLSESFKILSGKSKRGSVPELWDGNAAKRIVNTLEKGLRK